MILSLVLFFVCVFCEVINSRGMNLFAGSEIVLVEFIYLFIIIFGLVTVLDYPMLENQLNQVQTFVSG